MMWESASVPHSLWRHQYKTAPSLGNCIRSASKCREKAASRTLRERRGLYRLLTDRWKDESDLHYITKVLVVKHPVGSRRICAG